MQVVGWLVGWCHSEVLEVCGILQFDYCQYINRDVRCAVQKSYMYNLLRALKTRKIL